jgi:sugar/nucleoside kinase (ribokinase family)
VVGDDAAGTFVLAELAAAGVDTTAVRVLPGATPLSVILRAGADRAILTYRGVLDELSAADVPARLLADCRAVHAASYFLQPRLAAGLPALFATARAAGAATSLDTNDDPSDTWSGLPEVLAHTDVLLPNERELLRITAASVPTAGTTPPPGWAGPADASTVESAASALAATGVLPVVTLGAAGALTVAGQTILRAAAPPVSTVDSVGAGDSLTAGFLAGRLAGRPLADCLRLAVACGSLSTRAPGGTAGQPTLTEADAVAGTAAAATAGTARIA